MTTGRGAWNVQGVGGTKAYRTPGSTAPIKPGPYYFIGTGYDHHHDDDINSLAVWTAVSWYQAVLSGHVKKPVTVDGLFGPQTSAAVTEYQTNHPVPNTSPWGGIGPDTSRALMQPLLWARVAAYAPAIGNTIISGIVNTESMWDLGAVGYQDIDDLGLAQINGRAHPTMGIGDRLNPNIAIKFVCDYMTSAYRSLKSNLDDAIASYNLGSGGVLKWIDAGRPQMWQPAGSTEPRDVRAYINKIKQG